MTDRDEMGSDMQRPHRDALTEKVDTGVEQRGADAGTGAGTGVSASGVDASSGGPDAERNETGLGESMSGGGEEWQGGDPGLQADEGLMGRGGTGSLGSGGTSTPQSDARETSWQDEVGGMTGGAQGQAGVMGGESWEGRDRDTGTGPWTTGDAGFGSSTADDGGPQREDDSGGSSDRTDLG